ncbi:hypothetical protein GCM10010910_14120 [Microbacterium nanhaiense]|uniref:DUF4190 domain-containing protein n=1 Tax=Microbacterium nanhaiense TaxID=1301026 RepID=A0ABQ2N148_9MICO|nr:DUF4190 domain-containing protein [Microbacterium nanhaiense]GGO62890.1 hypothetical protein GCM10010910_14120 [Microbacterium nanhaiense]
MSDAQNPYDPQSPTFPRKDRRSDDVWDDPEPEVPLTPPPAAPQPGSEPAPGYQASYGTPAAGAWAPPARGPAGYAPPHGYPSPQQQYGGAPAGYGGPAPHAGPPQPAYPAAPGSGQGYPASPAAYGSGYARPNPYGYPPAPMDAPRPKGMAVTALVFAILGAMFGIVPFFALIGVPFALVAITVATVALAKRRAGRGMSVAALIVASLSLIWGVFMFIVTVLLGSMAGGVSLVDSISGNSYVETYANEDEVAAMLGDVELEDYVIAGSSSIPQYLVLVDNASAGTMYPGVTLTVNAVDADGDIIDTRTEFGDIYPGTSAFAGDFVVDSELIVDVTVDIDGLVMQKPVEAPEGNPLVATDVEVGVENGQATATGTIENGSDELRNSPDVVVVERDADGRISSYGVTWAPSISAYSTAPFTVTFPSSDTAPTPLTYDVHALPVY